MPDAEPFEEVASVQIVDAERAEVEGELAVRTSRVARRDRQDTAVDDLGHPGVDHRHPGRGGRSSTATTASPPRSPARSAMEPGVTSPIRGRSPVTPITNMAQ